MRVAIAMLAVWLAAQLPPLSPAEVDTFARGLRGELARGDRQAVAARVRYPIVVLAGGVRIPIADEATMIQSYPVVFTPALTTLVARDAPVVAGQVATLGAGAIDVSRVGTALKITRITVPVGDAATGTHDATPRPGARAPGTSAAPDRIGIEVGRAQRAGALAPGGRARYVVFVPKNRLLDVRIEGVRGRDIVARVLRAKDGEAVDARAKNGVRTWSGRVPEEGDYRIDVVRLAREPAGALPFSLTVTLR